MKSIFYFFALTLFVLTIFSCQNKPATTDAPTTADTTGTTAASDTTTATGSVPPPAGVKYGYLNSLQLLSLMPETKEADKKVADFTKKKENAFKSLVEKYQNRIKELQSRQADIPPIEMEKYSKELANMEEQIQEMQMRAEEDIAREKDKLYAPILEKADSVVKEIGRENGYMFIYDAAALLYADTTLNVLPLVKERMGIKK